MRNAFFFVIAFLSFVRALDARTDDLSAPVNTLGAANLYGYFTTFRDIDWLDFGNGLKLPLRTKFSSEWKTESPYLGKGWWIPLLESKAYLQREKMMRVELLCGKLQYLTQDKKEQNKYWSFDKQWSATIDRDNGNIVVFTPGGAELRYKEGRLRQFLTPQARLINWIYNGNLVTEIREEGVAESVLKILKSTDGKPNGLSVNGKLHQFELGKRPRVESIDGKNVVAGFDASLGRWKWPDATEETYLFEITPEIEPNLKLSTRSKKLNTFVWEPKNGHILSDDYWTYKVQDVATKFQLPKLERKGLKGEEEFVYADNEKGITEKKTAKTGHTVTEVFKSMGPLYNKTRSISKVDTDGTKRLVFRAMYDDNGRLSRQIEESGLITTFLLDKEGNLTGKKIEFRPDAETAAVLAAKEKSLLQDLSIFQTSGEGKDRAIRKLGLFYAKEMHDSRKALSLVSQIQDATERFNLQLHSILSDESLLDAQKADALEAMIALFPSQKEFLQFQVNKMRGIPKTGLSDTMMISTK